jgi:hypothetical protein
LVSTNASVVVASKTHGGIAQSDHLAVVPYGDGELTLKRTRGTTTKVTEHYFQGGKTTRQVGIASGELRLPLQEKTEDGSIVEWIEITVR